MKNTFKKINTENCSVEIIEESLKVVDPHYGDYYSRPEYSIDCILKDKETGKKIDTFTIEFDENGIQDLDDNLEWRMFVGEYFDVEDPEDFAENCIDEAEEMYDNLTEEEQEEFDKAFHDHIVDFDLELFDFYYFKEQCNQDSLIDIYLEPDDRLKKIVNRMFNVENKKDKFYSIGANGTVVLYDVEDADWNDYSDKILVGKGIKRVFNINQESFLQKKGDVVFSLDYKGDIEYYEKEKGVKDPDYLAVGENYGFYANKNNCGFFVEAK